MIYCKRGTKKILIPNLVILKRVNILCENKLVFIAGIEIFVQFEFSIA